jgi:hypothetical protein
MAIAQTVTAIPAGESRSVGRYLEPPVGDAGFVDSDLAAVVDVPGDGGNVEAVDVAVAVVVASVDAAGSIEGPVAAPLEQEAVLLAGGVEIAAHDLAAVVDAVGNVANESVTSNLRKRPSCQRKPWTLFGGRLPSGLSLVSSSA